MATHLVNRSQSLIRQVNPLKAALKHVAKGTKLAASKPGSRPLTVAYQQSVAVRALTTSLAMPYTTVRHYSGRDARRAQRQAAQVQVKERETETAYGEVVPHQERPPSYQHIEQQQQSYHEDMNQYRDPNQTSEDLINNAGVMAHLRKVYTMVGAAAGVAALGGLGAMTLGVGGGIAMASGFGALVPLIWALVADRSKVLLRQNLLLGAAALMGVGAAPLMGVAGLPAFLMALGGTGAIFAGFSLAALKAPSGSYLKFGGLLTAGALVILVAALLSMFGGALGIPAGVLAGLYNINLYGGLLILSLFIAYDTQSMIDRAAAGETDHVTDAINMFINVWGIFIRLLAIFGNKDD